MTLKFGIFINLFIIVLCKTWKVLPLGISSLDTKTYPNHSWHSLRPLVLTQLKPNLNPLTTSKLLKITLLSLISMIVNLKKKFISTSKTSARTSIQLNTSQIQLQVKRSPMIPYPLWLKSTKSFKRSKTLKIHHILNKKSHQERRGFAKSVKSFKRFKLESFLLEGSKKETQSNQKSLSRTLMKSTDANVERITFHIWESIVI